MHTKAQKEEMRLAYCRLACSIQPTAFIGLSPNREVGVRRLRGLLSKFFARLDRKRLGHTWMSEPPSIRTDGVAFVEHKDSNIHAHCLVRIPLYELSELKPFAETAWDRVIKGGTLKLDICCDRFDRAKYSTKEQLRFDYDWEEQIVLLREFMRS